MTEYGPVRDLDDDEEEGAGAAVSHEMEEEHVRYFHTAKIFELLTYFTFPRNSK